MWILRNWKQGKPDIYCSVKEAACGSCISEGYGYTGRLVLLCGLWSWDLSDQSFYCNFWKCDCNSVLYRAVKTGTGKRDLPDYKAGRKPGTGKGLLLRYGSCWFFRFFCKTSYRFFSGETFCYYPSGCVLCQWKQ